MACGSSSNAIKTYCRMIVCKCVIDIHIFEEPTDVVLEESLHLAIVKFGINKDSSDVSFDDIRESLIW